MFSHGHPHTPSGAEMSIAFIIKWLSVVCKLFLLLMMGHVGLDVFCKFFLNQPIEGTLETVSYYYMVSIVFLAFPLVEQRREHVAVDLFFNKFPAKLQVWIYVAGMMLACFYYGFFCYQTFLDAIKATRQQETVMANFLFYVWPSRWALPIGSGLLVVLMLLHAIRAVKTGRVEEDGHEVEAAT